MHEFDHNGYGEKKSKCTECGEEITIISDWLSESEESVVLYHCKKCNAKGWYFY